MGEVDVRKVAEEHLAAWSAGDAEAVAASVASYADPDSGGVLAGDGLVAYAAGVLARFAGPRFLVDRVTVARTRSPSRGRCGPTIAGRTWGCPRRVGPSPCPAPTW